MSEQMEYLPTDIVSGRNLRTVELPSARGLFGGYDRKAVDRLLVDCAEGVDRLTEMLIAAEDEIDRLLTENQRRRPRSSGPSPSTAVRRKRLRMQLNGRARRLIRMG
jgi:hypothetical protein